MIARSTFKRILILGYLTKQTQITIFTRYKVSNKNQLLGKQKTGKKINKLKTELVQME